VSDSTSIRDGRARRPRIDRTPAERLDRALDSLLQGGATPREPELRSLLDAADRLRVALPPVPVSARFEADLARRVATRRRINAGDLHVPTWLLVTGAVSSAAVGVGITAFAVWRGSRRSS
jgi:hypothetical protein